MNQEFDKEEYFTSGMRVFTTDSPFLISSSPWLDDPVVGDFVARHSLRRNHVSIPTTYDITECAPMVKKYYAQNIARIQALFIAERRKNPALNAWFEERFVSDLVTDTLVQYPKGSVGHLFHRYVVLNNFKPDFIASRELGSTHFEYFQKRLS